MDLIIKDFSPYDAPKDAIYEMKEMKMGNASIEEHVLRLRYNSTELYNSRSFDYSCMKYKVVY